MKRPVSHIIVPIACLLMLPFCLHPGVALGVEKTRGHVAGKFQLEIGNNDAGWVQSVEGGTATSDTVQEKLGPVPKQNTIAPQHSTNLRPVTPIAPAKPPCANPPCGLGQQQPAASGLKAQQDAMEDKKDSLSETSEEKQLRIQQYQERREKADAVLSNTMKKNSETQSGIISNMK